MAGSAGVSTQTTILLLGDSFLKRLRDWATENDKINLNLDSSRVKVVWEALGGMHANCNGKKNVWQHSVTVVNTKPKAVVLSIGSNDLGVCSVSAETVFNRIMEFISFCVQQNVCTIVVLELLPRIGQYPTFNEKISAVNHLLKEESVKRNSLFLWEHSRQHFNQRFLTEFVNADGVHMNQAGLIKFYTSVRGAVLWAESQSSGQVHV